MVRKSERKRSAPIPLYVVETNWKAVDDFTDDESDTDSEEERLLQEEESLFDKSKEGYYKDGFIVSDDSGSDTLYCQSTSDCDEDNITEDGYSSVGERDIEIECTKTNGTHDPEREVLSLDDES